MKAYARPCAWARREFSQGGAIALASLRTGASPRRRRLPPRRSALLPAALLAVLLLALLLLAVPRPAQAVTFQEQIERLRLIYAFLLDYRPGQAPLLPSGTLAEVSLELLRRPDVNHRVGNKQEPIDPPSVIPRVRARYLTRSGWMAGATAGIPLAVQGYKANWLGGEAGYRGVLGAWHTELRVFRIAGKVTGPITASAASDDFSFANTGADLRSGLPLGAWAVYAGLGGGRTHTELDIASDGAHAEGDNGYAYALAGAGWQGGPWVITLEQQASENFLRHYLLALAYRW